MVIVVLLHHIKLRVNLVKVLVYNDNTKNFSVKSIIKVHLMNVSTLKRVIKQIKKCILRLAEFLFDKS